MPSKNSNETVVDPTETTLPKSEGTIVESNPPSTFGWNLEEKSEWLGWINSPANILMVTSVPFFAGAYFGYRMPTEQLEELIQGSVGGTNKDSQVSSKAKTTSRKQINTEAVDKDAIRRVAARTASKAFRIATLGTVGTFGILGAVTFYLSGYNSLKEAVEGTTRWASSWGKTIEHAMGGDTAVSKTHPDVLATKNMDGSGELKYVYDKYIKDAIEDEDKMWGDANDSKTDKKASPTLYSVYEKYFKKKEDDNT